VRNAWADFKLHDAAHLRVGQMKVPLSSNWITQDTEPNFIEASTAEPLTPFLDRGAMAWGDLLGKTITYNIGVFSGVGIDLDSPKGDEDRSIDTAYRLFVHPFAASDLAWLKGLYLAGGGTYSPMTVPTSRFETRGLVAADFESLIWNWRTEQVIGTNGRNTDQIAATIKDRIRWGAEAHYLIGPLAISGEWLRAEYDDIDIYHDFWQGSTRKLHNLVLKESGRIDHYTVFVSLYLTGERKLLDNFGWRQPTPNQSGGIGAWEISARYSETHTDKGLFTSSKVSGYAGADLGSALQQVGQGGSVTAAVISGAPLVREYTVGIGWTMSYVLRIMLNGTVLDAVDHNASPAGVSGGIISGGNSNMSDLADKNKQVHREYAGELRFLLRI
jgi:phosphate-selective porin